MLKFLKSKTFAYRVMKCASLQSRDDDMFTPKGAPVFVPGATGKNLTTADVAPLPHGWNNVKHLTGKPADI